MKVCACTRSLRLKDFPLKYAICCYDVAVPRVFKATVEKYGEKCYMDWDKQELVIPAACDIPAHILDIRTE